MSSTITVDIATVSEALASIHNSKLYIATTCTLHAQIIQ